MKYVAVICVLALPHWDKCVSVHTYMHLLIMQKQRYCGTAEPTPAKWHEYFTQLNQRNSTPHAYVYCSSMHEMGYSSQNNCPSVKASQNQKLLDLIIQGAISHFTSKRTRNWLAAGPASLVELTACSGLGRPLAWLYRPQRVGVRRGKSREVGKGEWGSYSPPETEVRLHDYYCRIKPFGTFWLFFENGLK